MIDRAGRNGEPASESQAVPTVRALTSWMKFLGIITVIIDFWRPLKMDVQTSLRHAAVQVILPSCLKAAIIFDISSGTRFLRLRAARLIPALTPDHREALEHRGRCTCSLILWTW